jgi:hypothetical protein
VARGREVELPFVSKAPFANYDLVVYLGGGLFSILILWRYIGWPLGIFDFTSLTSTGPHSWVQDVIYLLIISVCAYVLGHMISYQSSYFIEGFIEKTLGKFSKIVEITTVDQKERAAAIRKEIKSNISEKLLTSIRIPTTKLFFPKPLPAIVHIPVLPWYGFVCLAGLFDFADTRLPSRMIACAKERMEGAFKDCEFHESRQWFRWIEYYTSYNRPVSAASMYNYLVISGLMRSLSYMFLIAIWLELAHLAWRLFDGQALISHGPGGPIGWGLYFFVLYVAYVTTVTSYCKFFRRYVEEAIMGFLLEESSGQSR